MYWARSQMFLAWMMRHDDHSGFGRRSRQHASILQNPEFHRLQGFGSYHGNGSHRNLHKHEPIYLFVSDIALPDLSGTEVALRLIHSHPGVRILFLSGTPMDDWCESDQRNFRQLPPGSIAFLEKPVPLSILKAKVESLMNSDARVSEARR